MRGEAGLPSIGELLLQREEMLLLDKILDFGEDFIEAAVTLAPDHPLAGNGQGIDAAVGIELMAQAISAYSALDLRERQLPPRIGLLLGTRLYQALTPFFPPDVQLKVRARLLLRDTSGLGVFDCTIHAGPALLAKAQVKGYMPDNIEQFLEAERHGAA